MYRCLQGAALLAICAASPALAADYTVTPDFGDLRPAYEPAWEESENSIRIELGVRYWYSWGVQEAAFATPFGAPVTLDVNDQTHAGELHARIDDLYTNTYLKGMAGIGFGTSGTYAISPAGSGAIGNDSRIGYATIDYGYMPLGKMDGPVAAGGFVGYTYWKDAPDIGTGQVAATFDGAGNPATFTSAQDNLDINAIRLGLRGTAEMGMFDIQAEVAAIPYAHVSGAIGGSSPNGFNFPGIPVPVYENSQATLSGRGYGVMTEAMVGFHPTENLTLRLGGRAWYVQGDLEAVINGTAGGAAQPALTVQSSVASIFRYGALFELTGRF